MSSAVVALLRVTVLSAGSRRRNRGWKENRETARQLGGERFVLSPEAVVPAPRGMCHKPAGIESAA
jgi:hypothetical protein